ncbi:MAG: hydroxyacid dehydrogenase [Candidatus Nomurabacteria bacterium]|nr:hydroxyacid dehydrogenase [Candidatus Nomurabacteria bacterium]
MKTIFFEISPEDKIKYQNLLQNQDVEYYEEKLSIDNISKAAEADILCVFINSEVKRYIIDALPNLKYIVTRSTGYDHIDGAYAKEKNINVSNIPSYGSNTVAEFTFGLILNLSRKIFQASHQIKEGNHFELSKLRGFDLNGKTLGVVGTGRIGRNVIHMAKGFNMNILAYDLFPNAEYATEQNIKYVTLDELLSNSDIITMHAPYTKENHHMINKDNILKIKKGSYIVNTARGELIDTEALLLGIQQGIISGVGLDVLEGERELKEEFHLKYSDEHNNIDYKTLLENHVLINIPEVIITPHVAFYTEEAENEIINTTISNITGFEKGQIQNTIKI